MTATCKRCGGDIAPRLVAGLLVYGHLVNPRNEHHYAVPSRTSGPEIPLGRSGGEGRARLSPLTSEGASR